MPLPIPLRLGLQNEDINSLRLYRNTQDKKIVKLQSVIWQVTSIANKLGISLLPQCLEIKVNYYRSCRMFHIFNDVPFLFSESLNSKILPLAITPLLLTVHNKAKGVM